MWQLQNKQEVKANKCSNLQRKQEHFRVTDVQRRLFLFHELNVSETVCLP